MPPNEPSGPLGDVGQQLDRIESNSQNAYKEAASSRKEAEQAYQEARAVNTRVEKLEKRVGKLEDDFYGPDDARRRDGTQGVIHRMVDVESRTGSLEKASGDVKAAISMKRWMIGTTVSVVLLLISLIGIVAKVAG